MYIVLAHTHISFLPPNEHTTNVMYLSARYVVKEQRVLKSVQDTNIDRHPKISYRYFGLLDRVVKHFDTK